MVLNIDKKSYNVVMPESLFDMPVVEIDNKGRPHQVSGRRKLSTLELTQFAVMQSLAEAALLAIQIPSGLIVSDIWIEED